MNSILTVSQLNRYVAFGFKEDPKLRGIFVKGEISGFTHHRPSGHFYFTLKDSSAAIKAVMFNSFASRLSFMPKNGMSVILSGNVILFERDGSYQINVTDICPDGVGALYLAYEQLKSKLSQKGLFDQANKKPLPPFPERIGLVTAEGGAALQDMLNILGRRYPLCRAVIFPCVVQGEYAADSICEALSLADKSGCDIIICGRGGGSAEDLAAFNSEKLARQVFAMNTPVISAVGHKTDTTIIDFVADVCAPTPSAAAELAVPLMSALEENLSARAAALNDAFSVYISGRKAAFLDRLLRLKESSPAQRLAYVRERCASLSVRLEEAAAGCIAGKRREIAERAAALDALSPLKIMSRGYGLIYRDDRLVTTAAALSKGDRITIRLADGRAEADICGIDMNSQNGQ